MLTRSKLNSISALFQRLSNLGNVVKAAFNVRSAREHLLAAFNFRVSGNTTMIVDVSIRTAVFRLRGHVKMLGDRYHDMTLGCTCSKRADHNQFVPSDEFRCLLRLCLGMSSDGVIDTYFSMRVSNALGSTVCENGLHEIAIGYVIHYPTFFAVLLDGFKDTEKLLTDVAQQPRDAVFAAVDKEMTDKRRFAQGLATWI